MQLSSSAIHILCFFTYTLKKYPARRIWGHILNATIQLLLLLPEEDSQINLYIDFFFRFRNLEINKWSYAFGVTEVVLQ
jgi:hypothetical protein